MPYQCLKCGSCFAEGTTTILRGCPDCRGMRFFFTEEPLTQRERDQRLRESEQQVPSLLQEITRRVHEPGSATQVPGRLTIPSSFQGPSGESQVLPDGSLVVKIPKGIEQRLRKVAAGWDYDLPAAPPAPTPAPVIPAAVAPVIPVQEPIASPDPAPPETVRIDHPGLYEIDVRRLLDRSPIVIQKDGTYLIHLPSLFEMPRKDGSR